MAYKMPDAELGFCVYYGESNPGADAIGSPALITGFGERSVNLTVFAEDNRAGIPKGGVKHRSDPELLERPGYDGGCWEESSLEARILGLEMQLAAMKTELESLTEAAYDK